MPPIVAGSSAGLRQAENRSGCADDDPAMVEQRQLWSKIRQLFQFGWRHGAKLSQDLQRNRRPNAVARLKLDRPEQEVAI